uniref:CMP-N-acetylneuraminate-beta-galactosamide-alpha-2,3-sialyltransferase 2 n=1 Tax=Callorhinchus milii TaxID=7868 RepID=A0A4W3K137_CALMI
MYWGRGWRRPRWWACLLAGLALLLCLHASLRCCSGGRRGRGVSSVCGCRTCVAQPGTDSWFDERFNSSVEPLLSTKNSWIHPDALHWWMVSDAGLSWAVLRAQHYSRILVSPKILWNPVAQCLQHSARKREDLGSIPGQGEKLGKFPYSTHLCLPVTFVPRMNRAAIAGFEPDVGTRTTHHFMYPESARDLQPHVYLVLVPFKLLDLMWLSSALSSGTYTRVKRYIKADRDKVLVIHPEFFKYVHENWTERHGRYPSTGLLTLVFALHLCDQVSVFGYGADIRGNWHHYWEKNRYAGAFRATGVHHAGFERQVITQLAIGGKIRLYPGQ